MTERKGPPPRPQCGKAAGADYGSGPCTRIKGHKGIHVNGLGFGRG